VQIIYRIYTTIKTVRLSVTGRHGWLGVVEKSRPNLETVNK